MLARGMYAVAVVVVAAAAVVGQSTSKPVVAVGQPYERPAPPLEATSPIQPVSFQPDGEARHSAAPGMPGSMLAIEAIGPASIAPDQPLAYEIIVRNPGTAIVGRVRVEDVLPPGAKLRSAEPEAEVQSDRLVWNLGNLDPGVERRIKVEIQPGAGGEVLLMPTATYTLAKPWRTRIVRPPFAVTQTVAETAPRGSAVSFQIHVANYSDQWINNIGLLDQLPLGLECPHGDRIKCEIPSLAPGETKSIKLDTRAVRPGRMTNVVTAQAEGGWRAESQVSVLVTETPLTVRLDAPKQTLIGQDVDFRLEIVNPGNVAAANVRVTQAVPDGVEFINASTGGMLDAAKRTVYWTLGTLAAGQTQTLTMKVRTRAAGDWIFKSAATTDGAPEATTFQTLHIEGAPSLWLEVVRHDEAIDLGAESVYEVRVLNQGTVGSPGVRLTAAVSEGLLVLNAEGPTTVLVQQKQIVFQPLKELPGRADAVYRIRVKGQTAGNWGLTVQATADQLARPLVQQVSTRVVAR